MNDKFAFLTSINDVPQEQWNQLTKGMYPFLRHEFLSALENSRSVSIDSGWQPFHLTLMNAVTERLMAAMPLYIKTHSYGEYIFDWAWADAYRRYGMHYYPKLLCAIPFTPVTGPRILFSDNAPSESTANALRIALQEQVQRLGLSSCHILYPDEQQMVLPADNWLRRQNVQFQWHNRNYGDFDDFLDTFTSRKRKNLRKERQKVREQDVAVFRVSGNEITEQHMAIFYQCYQDTYLKRSGHKGYLNKACFMEWWQTMRNSMMLVLAQRQSQVIASALYFYNGNGLYGRYWGCLEDVDALHFECCYYQGIEFSIDNKLPLFNPGTQGEHKIQRGFEPIICHSSHWIEDQSFRSAIQHFTEQEKLQTLQYKNAAEGLLPFKTVTKT